ncbi:MAG: DUF6178 family protein [Pseudomonadota bacterium]
MTPIQNSDIPGGGDYRLANVMRKEKQLARIRSSILGMDSEKALDAILSSSQPATLVQSFPDQDLYYLMHSVGPDDFLPVLSLASSEQWEYIMDMDIWDRDGLHLPRMTTTLALLFRADPKRFLRWMVQEKPDLLDYFLNRNIEVRVREHDEDPSSFPDGFETIDDVMYFRFPEVPRDLPDDEATLELHGTHQGAEDLITEMINTIADMDLSVMNGLLMESQSIIRAETEEEEFRLRTVRLAEKGFLPYHEAIGMYQPLKKEDLVQRPGSSLSLPVLGTDLPHPPVYFTGLFKGQGLFVESLDKFNEDPLLNLQSETASLVNRLVSADSIIVREKEDLEKAVRKTCNTLGLGLEVIHGASSRCTPSHGAAIIRKYTLEAIFRVGSGVCMDLKFRARAWHKESWAHENNLPLSFFGDQWLGVLGGLFLDKPLYFDGYGSGSGSLYRPFACLADVDNVSRALGEIMATDRLIRILDPDIKTFSRGVLTWKSLVLTLWVRHRLGLQSSLEAIDLDLFRPFFRDLFAGRSKGKIDGDRRKDMGAWLNQVYGLDADRIKETLGNVFESLFDELEDEYGAVQPERLDVRLVIHFLLKE